MHAWGRGLSCVNRTLQASLCFVSCPLDGWRHGLVLPTDAGANPSHRRETSVFNEQCQVTTKWPNFIAFLVKSDRNQWKRFFMKEINVKKWNTLIRVGHTSLPSSGTLMRTDMFLFVHKFFFSPFPFTLKFLMKATKYCQKGNQRVLFLDSIWSFISPALKK